MGPIFRHIVQSVMSHLTAFLFFIFLLTLCEAAKWVEDTYGKCKLIL